MTLLATDDFNRANNADLGASWDATTGEDAFNIISNVAADPTYSSVDAGEINNTVTWPNDQYFNVELILVSADGVGSGYGGLLRAAGGGVRSQYRVVANGSGWEFSRFDTGTSTSLASAASPTFATGDFVWGQIVGSTFILKKNGVSFGSPPTDSTYTTGKVGISHSTPSGATSGINSFQGGDMLLRRSLFVLQAVNRAATF